MCRLAQKFLKHLFDKYGLFWNLGIQKLQDRLFWKIIEKSITPPWLDELSVFN